MGREHKREEEWKKKLKNDRSNPKHNRLMAMLPNEMQPTCMGVIKEKLKIDLKNMRKSH